MKQNFFKKNISLRIAICLALFIPLVIAIIYGLNVNPLTVTPESLVAVKVTTPEGHDYKIDDKESIEFYTSLTVGSNDDITKDFRDLTKETPYKITFVEQSGNSTVEIQHLLYTHEKTTDYVYVVPEEKETKYYLLSEEVAKKLSERKEFSKQTDMSTILPVASVSAFGITTPLSASGCDWTYYEEDGTKMSVSLTSDEKKNPIVKFDLTENGIPKFNFDKQPDSLNLTIKNQADSDPIFDGKIEELPNSNVLTYNHDEKLTATVVADWYEIEGAEYFGKATYNFDLLFDVAPTYEIVNDYPLPTGDFTLLKITDFNDGEQLTVVNEIGIPEKVNVYDIEGFEEKITFIPLGSTLGTNSHKLTLKTDLGQTFEISVGSKDRVPEYGSQTLIINEETDSNLSKAFTKEALAEFDGLRIKYTNESANNTPYIYHKVKFEYPTGSKNVVAGGASYGTKRTVISINSANEKYVSMGSDLECMTNQNIVAANDGKVVFAGETTLLGNTVIIDHGYGVLSYYGNLSSINVKQGETVEKKTSVIGIAGSTGFACADTGVAATTKTMCHYAVSMNGVFVDPNAVAVGIYLN